MISKILHITYVISFFSLQSKFLIFFKIITRIHNPLSKTARPDDFPNSNFFWIFEKFAYKVNSIRPQQGLRQHPTVKLITVSAVKHHVYSSLIIHSHWVNHTYKQFYVCQWGPASLPNEFAQTQLEPYGSLSFVRLVYSLMTVLSDD